MMSVAHRAKTTAKWDTDKREANQKDRRIFKAVLRRAHGYGKGYE
jgi:hypothetical protein